MVSLSEEFLGFRLKLMRLGWCLCLPALTFAAQIKGTVENGTTGKPVAGDAVVLLSLAGGMDEVGRTTTDRNGQFTVTLPKENNNVPYLVRVVHQGVNYHKIAPPGTASIDITVYDAERQVNNLLVEARVLRMQTSGNELEVSESYTLRNESQPPRTLIGEQTLRVAVPEGARVVDGMVAGPGGMPTTNPPTATKDNHYAFNYPIRPGPAQFQITYRLPYTGSYQFRIAPETSLAEFGILLPKSMKFSGAPEFVQDSDQSGMAVYFARAIRPDQELTFAVSGEGSVPRAAQSASADAPSAGPPRGNESPASATSSASNSPVNALWYVIVVIAVIVAMGAFWLPRRLRTAGPQSSSVPLNDHEDIAKVSQAPARDGVIDALKEELFQLESDWLRQEISQDEYDLQKAGLDSLLRRQMQEAGRLQKT